MWAAILSVVSIVAFALSLMGRAKAETILVCHTMTVSEDQVKKLGLYHGLALRLSCADENDMVQVWVKDAAGQDVQLGRYTSPIEYDILKNKVIRAFVYSIYGDAVVIEIKLNEALRK